MIRRAPAATIPIVGLTALSLALGAGCRATAPSSAPTPITLAPGVGVVGPGSAAALAQADQTARRFVQADVDFMSGMIPHHAQAIIMAGWAPSHGARADVRILCEKIVVAQRDEIRSMSRWLADHGQAVPDSTATKHHMNMGGTMMDMLMPGMLSGEQMAALDKARGSQFDRLFLEGMIGHHLGAINMVHELYSHPGAAQDETVFRFASDVDADQSAEIHRMQIMLETVPR